MIDVGIDVGRTAPDFALPDTFGNMVRLSALRGKIVALYFYPKDDTPGCTKQACSIRDGYAEITARGIVVLGVSADDAASHQHFVSKFNLPFPLLSDPDLTTIKAYGAWGEKNLYGKITLGILRHTFIIDREGVVRRVFKKVNTEEHAQEILEAARAIGG